MGGGATLPVGDPRACVGGAILLGEDGGVGTDASSASDVDDDEAGLGPMVGDFSAGGCWSFDGVDDGPPVGLGAPLCARRGAPLEVAVLALTASDALALGLGGSLCGGLFSIVSSYERKGKKRGGERENEYTKNR